MSETHSLSQRELEELETDLLLEAIHRRYGYDFRNYARASLKRRIAYRLRMANLEKITDMLSEIVHDEEFFNNFLGDMSVTVTDMYRDPNFYKVMRDQVFPMLKTYPFVKIWLAGCATGEEAYSIAILLEEEGYYDRTRIYATDYNKQSLSIAEQGIYPAERLQKYAENYLKVGGKAAISDYCRVAHNLGKIDESLKRNIVFSYHNLVSDGAFGEMNMIVCRNVMIYFNKTLQDRVLRLFFNSLSHQGVLCLGSKESIKHSGFAQHFEAISRSEKIYKKTIRQL